MSDEEGVRSVPNISGIKNKQRRSEAWMKLKLEKAKVCRKCDKYMNFLFYHSLMKK